MSSRKVPTCKVCGVEVLWFRRPEGGMHPPVVPLGEVLVVRDGVVHTERAYARHRCNDQDATAFAKNEARAREAQAEGIRRREQNRRDYEQHTENYAASVQAAWSEALPRQCPKCHVGPHARCLNLVVLNKTGETKPTVWPHTERRITPTPED